MELPFVDPSETPVPPEEMRIRSVTVRPYSDRRRLKISLELTPFQRSPDIEVVAKDEQGVAIASASIIGAVANELSLTLHLRKQPISDRGQIWVVLTYQEQGEVHEQEVTFNLSEAIELGED